MILNLPANTKASAHQHSRGLQPWRACVPPLVQWMLCAQNLEAASCSCAPAPGSMLRGCRSAASRGPRQVVRRTSPGIRPKSLRVQVSLTSNSFKGARTIYDNALQVRCTRCRIPIIQTSMRCCQARPALRAERQTPPLPHRATALSPHATRCPQLNHGGGKVNINLAKVGSSLRRRWLC